MDKDFQTVKKYLLYTFLITWISWGLMVLLTNLDLINNQGVVGRILFFIGGFGPTIAALIVMESKDRNLKGIHQYIKKSNKGSWKVLLIFIILTFMTFFLPTRAFNPQIPLFMFPAMIAMLAFVGGGNEELGWRGLMQPILEKKFGFIAATLITATIWGIWHLPLWFIKGDPHRATPFYQFFILGIFLSFLLASLYKGTKSVLYTMIYHGFLNATLSFVQIMYNLLFFILVSILTLIAIIYWYYVDKTARSNEMQAID